MNLSLLNMLYTSEEVTPWIPNSN